MIAHYFFEEAPLRQSLSVALEAPFAHPFFSATRNQAVAQAEHRPANRPGAD